MSAPLALLPQPSSLKFQSGSFLWNRDTTLLLDATSRSAHLVEIVEFADEIQKILRYRPDIRPSENAPSQNAVSFSVRPSKSASPESYQLIVRQDSVSLVGAGAQGLYYGLQTLLQMIRQSLPALPKLTISDSPDFAIRGVYHDATRGKVPTLETLFALVEKLAHYKINHFQLYIEHTFAYRKHTDIWQGADPLTAEEILRLDEFCARHHVELVPSFSTFGHLYTLIHSKRKEHLNELDILASKDSFSWWDRMAHYTIDPLNPESIALIREIIHEVRPLFRSRYFNICCDETFDLGKGRNKASAGSSGIGRLYVDFLKKVMSAVQEVGAVPMFWADIIGKYPELLGELPKNVIALDWDYSAEIKNSQSAKIKKAKLSFISCPGVHGWNNWLNNIHEAHQNITGLAKQGYKDGALGILNTDWGDYGHINFLGNSLHGLILGAAASWNVKTPANAQKPYDAAFSRLEWNDSNGDVLKILRRGVELSAHSGRIWQSIEFLRRTSTDFPDNWFHSESGIPNSLLGVDTQTLVKNWGSFEPLLQQLETAIAHACPRDPLMAKEAVLSFHMSHAMQAFALVLHRHAGKRTKGFTQTAWEVADTIRRLEPSLGELWHKRNKPSEYFRIRLALTDACNYLDSLPSKVRKNK